MKKLVSLLLMLALLTACTAPAADPAPTEVTTPPAAETMPVETLPPETEAPTEPSFDPDTLTVTFIDVGQADSALLACGGEYALIDAGYPEGGEKVVDYLTTYGIESLDLVVATHPHGDHIGGLPAVLEAFPAETVWSSRIPYSNDYTYSFTSAVKAQGLSITIPNVGDTFELGDATITVIGPVHMYYDDVNNISLVLMVQFGETRFLFTGDMERDAEIDLLDSGADVKADVLKVGHHGSYTSTSYVFLREVMPTYAVICCGGNNDYGHPHTEPMSRLKDADVTIYRTDKMYTITAVSDGENIDFSWTNSYAKPWTPED